MKDQIQRPNNKSKLKIEPQGQYHIPSKKIPTRWKENWINCILKVPQPNEKDEEKINLSSAFPVKSLLIRLKPNQFLNVNTISHPLKAFKGCSQWIAHHWHSYWNREEGQNCSLIMQKGLFKKSPAHAFCRMCRLRKYKKYKCTVNEK